MPWKDDGSGQLTVSDDGNGVRCTSRHGGDGKANAIFTGGHYNAAAGGCSYWEFDVTTPDNNNGGGGVWIGVCMAKQFKAGYGLKGLLYGGPGNLGDGSSLVASNWGPQLANGDRIGLRVERRDAESDGHVMVAFSRNGSPLGIAFDIVGWKPEEDLFPVVCFASEGQAVTMTTDCNDDPSKLPDLETFKASPTVPDGLEGDWVGHFTLCINSKGDNSWQVSAHVANNMFCTLTSTPEGGWVSSGVGSTMMMPPPELQELEEDVKAMLEGVTGLKRDGDTLVLEGNGKTEVFNAAPPSSAATKEQVNWMRDL